jgi:FixJ family two-component response regulator
MAAKQALIVVVDDDDGMRQALRRLLSAAGFRAHLFDSAEALLASGCAASADCLILDMRLPGMSGVECYASMAEPRPPAVFITGHDGPAARRSVEEVGGRACVAKPFDGAEFLELVNVAARTNGGNA